MGSNLVKLFDITRNSSTLPVTDTAMVVYRLSSSPLTVSWRLELVVPQQEERAPDRWRLALINTKVPLGKVDLFLIEFEMFVFKGGGAHLELSFHVHRMYLCFFQYTIQVFQDLVVGIADYLQSQIL